MRLFTNTHCNKRRRERTREAKTTIHSVEKKRKKRRTKSEKIEKKNKSENDTVKKGMKKEK